jgi:hypothetical protein
MPIMLPAPPSPEGSGCAVIVIVGIGPVIVIVGIGPVIVIVGLGPVIVIVGIGPVIVGAGPVDVLVGIAVMLPVVAGPTGVMGPVFPGSASSPQLTRRAATATDDV